MTVNHSQRASSRGLLWRLAAITALLFCWVAVLSFDPLDWPATVAWPEAGEVRNACGPVGAWLAYYGHLFFGQGVHVVLVLITAWCLAVVAGVRLPDPFLRAVGAALLVAASASILEMLRGSLGEPVHMTAGGTVGIALSDLLRVSFNRYGALLVLAASVLVGLILAADEAVTAAVRAGRAGLGRMKASPVDALLKRLQAEPAVGQRPSGTGRVRRLLWWLRGGQQAPADPPQTPDTVARQVEDPSVPVSTVSAETISEASEPLADREGKGTSQTKGRGTWRRRAVATWPTELKNFELPPLSLLANPEPIDQSEHEKQVRTKARVLEQTLRDFRVDARVVQIDTGPVITIYELELAPGIKVSQITSLSNDIARVLRAPAVRVVAPIPGKNTVGIEVPNLNKERVRLRELLETTTNVVGKMQLPLFLGKDASGKPLVADLALMPHLLIAGTTGSGKSVCINSLIMSLLMTQRPDHVKLILVDPKMVELSIYSEVPHLMCPIVTDIQQAELILDWAATKMDERYELLAEAGVRHIAAYNRLSQEELIERFNPATEEERARIPLHLPYIVIVIDELADLMMTSGKEVEFCLSRLAQKSRAVGIHIILATQRPQANVVTGLIKSNMPCRIAFRVASRMDSRIVLDQNGAEVLMGQGDMLFLPPGSAKLIRAQGTFVDEGEIRRVVDYLKERAPQEFHEELVTLKAKERRESQTRDPLFDEAVRIVLETQRGSVSLLQRRLMIGYSRAARLIDQMADLGIVGGYKGSQAREVLMTLEEWEEYCKQRPAIEADEARDREVFEDEPA